MGGHPDLYGPGPLGHHLVQPHLECGEGQVEGDTTDITSNTSFGRIGRLVSTTPKLKSSAALGLQSVWSWNPSHDAVRPVSSETRVDDSSVGATGQVEHQTVAAQWGG